MLVVTVSEWIRHAMPYLLIFTGCVAGSCVCLGRSYRLAMMGEGAHHAHTAMGSLPRRRRVGWRVYRVRCSCRRVGCTPRNGPCEAPCKPPPIPAEVLELAIGLPPGGAVGGAAGSGVEGLHDPSGAPSSATSAMWGLYAEPALASWSPLPEPVQGS